MKKAFLLLFIIVTFVLAIASGAGAEEVSRPITAWPLLYHSEEQGRAETDALFSLYHYERRDSWTRYSFGYFIFATESDPAREFRKTSVLWPLGVYKREGEHSSSHLFPFYWQKSSPERSYSVFFPLYWAGEGKDYSYTHLWPLFSRQEEGSYREYGTLYPLIRVGRDPVKDIALAQFLLYYHKREQNNSFTTLFPLYGRKVEDEEKKTWLLPLYYSQSDADSLLTLAPLYYHRKEPGSDSLHLWPLFSREERGSYREYGALYPLIRVGRDPVKDIALAQFLLYYHKREQNNSFTAVFPLYGRKVEGQEKKTWLFPLYYSQSDADSLLTIAPLYFHHKDPGSESLHLWPLFSRREQGSYREYGALYPLIRFGRDREKDIELDQFLLYYHKREQDKSFTTVFPLFWSTIAGAKKQQVLFPLYYHREDEDSLLTLAPLYYHRKEPGSDSLYFWPFYRLYEKGSYREHGVLWPLIRFGRDREKDLELDQFLLYYHKREQDKAFTTLFPLWFSSRKPQAAWDLLLPIYFGRKTPEESMRIVAPLYYHRETPDTSVRTIIPLYHSRREPEGHFRYIFPTYFSSVTGTTRLRTFLPFYLQYDSPTVEFSAITPLYMKRKSEESAFTTLLPLYYDYERKDFGITVGVPVYLRYRSEQFSFKTVFPLYFNAEDKEQQSAFTYYFPFYGEYKRGDVVSRHFLLFPLYSRYADQEQQLTGWDVLWPFFHYEASPTTRSVRIPPFYWHGSRPDNAYTVFFPLYWSFDSGENSYRHLIPFYGVHREGDWYKKTFVLGPLFMDTRDSRAGLSQQDALLWLYSRRVENEQKLSWLFPVYYHRSDADSLLTLALPVLPYYHRKEPDKEKLVLFPIYSLRREKTYTEHASFWPLIRFGRDREKDIALDQFLLYYHKREQDKAFTTVFPLFWSTIAGAKKQQVIFPLYYHREDEDSLLTLALPVLPYYHRREADKDTLHLWPLFSRKEQGSYREYGALYPLIRFGRDREKDIALDQFLLYYHKREQDRSFTTVFPIFWSTIAGAKKQQVLFPLYYHREDVDSLLTIAPLYYHRKEPGSDSLHLWPLFSRKEQGSYREYGALYPLIRFGKDGEKDVELDQFLLYYHKREQDRSFTTVFPLFWSTIAGARKQQVLFPLYYHYEDEDSLLTFAPFYYHQRDEGANTLYVWPIYRWHEAGSYREHAFLWPLVRFGRDPVKDITLSQFLLYYHKREQNDSFTAVFPLYGRKVEGPEKKTWLIPLYYSQSDADSLLTLAPFYYHQRDPGTNTLYVWPIYRWHEQGTYQEHALLWPLIRFGRDPMRDVELDQFLLYYHRREGTASLSTVFPVWWHQEKDENRQRDLTLLLHWYERDETRDETDLSLLWLVPPKISLFHYNRRGTLEQHRLFPLYSYSFDKEQDAMSWSVLWFLFSYSSEGEFVKQTGFLWKVISYERKDAETSDFRFLWRVIRKSATPTSSIFEFNPFYYTESEEGKGSYWAVLGGLFGVETTPEHKKRYRVFWLF